MEKNTEKNMEKKWWKKLAHEFVSDCLTAKRNSDDVKKYLKAVKLEWEEELPKRLEEEARITVEEFVHDWFDVDEVIEKPYLHDYERDKKPWITQIKDMDFYHEQWCEEKDRPNVRKGLFVKYMKKIEGILGTKNVYCDVLEDDGNYRSKIALCWIGIRRKGKSGDQNQDKTIFDKFIADCLDLDRGNYALSSDMEKCYKDWCLKNRAIQFSEETFRVRMWAIGDPPCHEEMKPVIDYEDGEKKETQVWTNCNIKGIKRPIVFKCPECKKYGWKQGELPQTCTLCGFVIKPVKRTPEEEAEMEIWMAECEAKAKAEEEADARAQKEGWDSRAEMEATEKMEKQMEEEKGQKGQK